MSRSPVYPEVYDLARFKEKRKEFPPFGVLYLASVAEQAGHDVTIFKVTDQDWRLELTGFEAVGFSIPSSATYGIIKNARLDSTYRDDPLIMVGGVHPSFYPERTLTDIRPHVVSIGEGEDTFLELLTEAQTRRFERVDGVCYFGDRSPTRTPPRKPMRDIDMLPLPARHLLDSGDLVMADRLSSTDLRMAHVMFSRGCPFPCRFCAAAQTRIQYRSGASARLELEHMTENYGIDGFAIVDDNFIVNKNKVRDICLSIRDLGLRCPGWIPSIRLCSTTWPLPGALRSNSAWNPAARSCSRRCARIPNSTRSGTPCRWLARPGSRSNCS